MHIRVRTIDAKEEVILSVSKITLVEELKRMLEKELQIDVNQQRLFFRGKQLENDYKLYDYRINVNDVVQLMIKQTIVENLEEEASCSDNEKTEETKKIEKEEELLEADSLYYKIGDAADYCNEKEATWYEVIIEKILKKKEQIFHKVRYEFDDAVDPFNVPEAFIRPRARHILSIDKLSVGQTVMINYNLDDCKLRGLWYDFTISNINLKRRSSNLIGMLHISGGNQLEINFSPKENIYAIETPKLLIERTAEDDTFMISNGKCRPIAATCLACMDNENKDCRECGCKVCAGKHDPDKLLMCDQCDYYYHLVCLNPPLLEIPEDSWYCPECETNVNEIVKAGERLKPSKKRANQQAAKTKTKWGSGMACAGRTKECTVVHANHRGPVPGVEVGMSWHYRVQASEVGVHRPHVAGIHGREYDCAYSIVLSGGYEDDIDNGYEFVYTGSGGRDLTGNKRIAKSQAHDQKLTHMNLALARNCNAVINKKDGATAVDWKAGIPVRVLRSSKLGLDNKYAPQMEDFRYDGIYKVVKYYAATGKSGFRVWRYLLRRDDPSPAPWTKEGKEIIALNGYVTQHPDGYEEAQMKKANKGKKRPFDNANEKPSKKQCHEGYKLTKTLSDLIQNDKLNEKLWSECCKELPMGKITFLECVSERFMCACCLEIVYNPVTTPCSHNICLKCLKRSFASEVYFCPTCRCNLSKDKMNINESLASALSLLYPGYEGGR